MEAHGSPFFIASRFYFIAARGNFPTGKRKILLNNLIFRKIFLNLRS